MFGMSCMFLGGDSLKAMNDAAASKSKYEHEEAQDKHGKIRTRINIHQKGRNVH